MPTSPADFDNAPTGDITLAALFARFLRFGLLAWGGPVAQIAMIKRELVEEERWVSPARFNRLLAVYQLLPGPEAHELCVHFGIIKRGRLGGLLAGLGFMLPGFLLMLALAWAYRRLDLNDPHIDATLFAIQVAVVALIVRAVHRIGEHILLRWWHWTIAALAFAVAFWGKGPVAVDLPSTTTAVSAGAMTLFLTGLKAGLFTFGGAYTAIPFVRHDAVGRGWVSDGQFLDGLALGGIIPAPLVMFATFVGFLAGGLPGALAITAGIFLPAFGFGLLFFDRLEKIVDNEALQTFLGMIAAGVVGLIAATAVDLGLKLASEAPSIPLAGAVFLVSLAVLYLWKSKLNVLAVIVLAALAGLASGAVV